MLKYSWQKRKKVTTKFCHGSSLANTWVCDFTFTCISNPIKLSKACSYDNVSAGFGLSEAQFS